MPVLLHVQWALNPLMITLMILNQKIPKIVYNITPSHNIRCYDSQYIAHQATNTYMVQENMDSLNTQNIRIKTLFGAVTMSNKLEAVLCHRPDRFWESEL